MSALVEGAALMQIKAARDFVCHMETMFHSSSTQRFPALAIHAAKIAFLLALSWLIAGCGQKAEPSQADLRQYEVRGIVRGLPPDEQTIEIEHETVPGFMPAMTMPFIMRDQKARAQLRPGDAVSFRLNVTAQDSWIDRTQRIAVESVHLPTPPAKTDAPHPTSPRLHEGDLLPAFRLIDQDGKEITLETFRGRPFVLTFIFTRCPIPNFCPRMSQNFAELQKAIKSGGEPLAEARLLSISFDPAYDTPAVLHEHARLQGAEPAIWTFATGAATELDKITEGFSLVLQPESGSISHSLATALIDADGRIEKIWRGNGWQPVEVIKQLNEK